MITVITKLNDSVQTVALSKFTWTSQLPAVITKSWGKVQEGAITFHSVLEAFNLLLFLTKLKQHHQTTHDPPLAYSLIFPSFTFSSLPSSFSQETEEYREEEEERWVDFGIKKDRERLFHFSPSGWTAYGTLLKLRPRTAWAVYFNLGWCADEKQSYGMRWEESVVRLTDVSFKVKDAWVQVLTPSVVSCVVGKH